MDNQHIQKHIQTVREALSKATPGEWKGKHAITPYISVVTGVVDEVIATVPTRKNMHLIANAPTWLQTSIEIIEQQQREIAELRSVLDPDDSSKIVVDKDEVSRLQVERDKAVEQLKWINKEIYWGDAENAIDKVVARNNSVLSELGVPHETT